MVLPVLVSGRDVDGTLGLKRRLELRTLMNGLSICVRRVPGAEESEVRKGVATFFGDDSMDAAILVHEDERFGGLEVGVCGDGGWRR